MTHGWFVRLLWLLRSACLAQGPSEILNRPFASQQEREKLTRIHVLMHFLLSTYRVTTRVYRRRASATRHASHRTFKCSIAARIVSHGAQVTPVTLVLDTPNSAISAHGYVLDLNPV